MLAVRCCRTHYSTRSERKSGLPFQPAFKKGRVWRLASDKAVPLPPVILNRAQATALFISARLLNQHSGRLSPIAMTAIQKQAQALPPEIGAFLQKDYLVVDSPLTPDLQNSQQIFARLVTAWIEIVFFKLCKSSNLQSEKALLNTTALSEHCQDYEFRNFCPDIW
ncbi:MAG TPA: hypothetical protein VH186_33855 [Chloroflexia bacterium]|nr:hypothetical protein [Chloroflexia bacterium]